MGTKYMYGMKDRSIISKHTCLVDSTIIHASLID